MDQPIRPIFDPTVMPARDKYGYAWHPDLDSRWEHPVWGEEYLDKVKLAEAGFDLTFQLAGDDFNENMDEVLDCSAWTPPDLSADGRRIVGIGDTERGYCAWYVRAVSGDEQVELVALERAALAKLVSA